jgi:hypothetical protein
MHRDVIGFVALDLVLRILGARVMGVTLVVGVLRMHLGDLAAHVARFRIPAYVIAYFEFRIHLSAAAYIWIKADKRELALENKDTGAVRKVSFTFVGWF